MTKDQPLRTATWGRIRDALAAVHNLETLLRSPRVRAAQLAELVPELLASCDVLRAAFDDAEAVLATYARERVDMLEQALRDAGSAGLETRARLALELVMTNVRGQVDATVDLLDLSARARADQAGWGELSLGELTRAALGMAGSVPPSSEGLLVRVDTEDAACIVRADPQVVARVLGGAIVRAREGGVRDAVVRARCHALHVTLSVSAATAEDAELPQVTTRGMRRVPPTDAVLDGAAKAMGGSLVIASAAVVLSLPVALEKAP